MPKTASKIDKKIFEQLCVQQCSEKDIAEYFGCHRDSINKFCQREYNSSFSSYLALKRREGQAVLVNKALKLAEKNGAVMIFLLKNWCNYKDNPAEKNELNEELIKQFGAWFSDKQADSKTT